MLKKKTFRSIQSSSRVRRDTYDGNTPPASVKVTLKLVNPELSTKSATYSQRTQKQSSQNKIANSPLISGRKYNNSVNLNSISNFNSLSNDTNDSCKNSKQKGINLLKQFGINGEIVNILDPSNNTNNAQNRDENSPETNCYSP